MSSNDALPNNKNAEMALIADILLNNDIITSTIGVIRPQDFYYKSHEIIYTKMQELYKKNITIDSIVLSNSMEAEQLKSIGGLSYLMELTTSEISTVNYKEYIRIIKDLSQKRKIISSCRNAIHDLNKNETSANDALSKLQSDFVLIDSLEKGHKTVNASELMQETISIVEDGFNNGGKIRGITTGYKPLDKALNGFVKGDLVVIAARPSMGKTALILNMINKIPTESKTLLCELEMSIQKIGIRLLAPKVLIDSESLAKGEIRENQFELIMDKAGFISKKDNIFINCKSGLNVGEIAAEAKKIKLRHGLDVLFVDHVGLIKPDNPRATRNDQLGEISEGLKGLAKDLDICVIALSQLNRALEGRSNKHPIMSDLRDSGNLEQNADSVLLLYRDDYYAEREGRDSKNQGIMEIMIAKNRDGQVGKIELSYNSKYQIITEKPIFTG
ncbi:MAG: replicative DNA helicase [Clostridiaceae bacterium]